MTDIEETIQRIQAHKGVIGLIIVNNEGIPIRTNLDNSSTNQHIDCIRQLAIKASSAVRDIDPSNELTFCRIRSKKNEIMVAPEKDYMVIVIQELANTNDYEAL